MLYLKISACSTLAAWYWSSHCICGGNYLHPLQHWNRNSYSYPNMSTAPLRTSLTGRRINDAGVMEEDPASVAASPKAQVQPKGELIGEPLGEEGGTLKKGEFPCLHNQLSGIRNVVHDVIVCFKLHGWITEAPQEPVCVAWRGKVCLTRFSIAGSLHTVKFQCRMSKIHEKEKMPDDLFRPPFISNPTPHMLCKRSGKASQVYFAKSPPHASFYGLPETMQWGRRCVRAPRARKARRAWWRAWYPARARGTCPPLPHPLPPRLACPTCPASG